MNYVITKAILKKFYFFEHQNNIFFFKDQQSLLQNHKIMIFLEVMLQILENPQNKNALIQEISNAFYFP